MLIVAALLTKKGRKVAYRLVVTVILITIAYTCLWFARWTPTQEPAVTWEPSACATEGDGLCW